MTAVPFALAYVLVLLSAALTVSSQVCKLVTVYPAHVLGES